MAAGLSGGLVAATLPAMTGAPQAEVYPFDLSELTIAELQNGLQSGKYTARSLTEKYLARIEAIDRQGLALRSVIEINPDALALAGALDKERNQKGQRGPLHGIPVLIKDNIDTA